MKLLYLDCQMGAAGDMLTAALMALFPQPELIVEELNALKIPHVHFERQEVTKCGISGTGISVKINGKEEGELPHAHIPEHSREQAHNHSHRQPHNTLHGIEHLLSHTKIPERLRENIMAVYGLLADAESKAHNVPVSEIHFHEVGTLDAVADITAVCFLMDRLKAERIVVSPVHVGCGQVSCAHGILPVPAPATAYLLQGCPIYGGTIQGELCTPTGAALLKYFADDFGEMPVTKVSAIGYGMGKKDFPAVNCVRAMLGEAAAEKELLYELNCNVDDMTPEQMGYALERLLNAGALEAFTIPVNMKKSRPGMLLCVICEEEKRAPLIREIFKHTSTAGIREARIRRNLLDRRIVKEETPYGTIRRKEYSGYGVARSKYEYEDLAQIASKHQLSIAEVLKSLHAE